MLTIDAGESINLSLRVLLNKEDQVLILDPAYMTYSAEVQLNNGIPIMVPTYDYNNFTLTIDALEKYVPLKAKAILMGFPSNPTGAIMTKAQLQNVADFSIRHNLIVINNEIYSALTYDMPHTNMASLPNMKEQTIHL